MFGFAPFVRCVYSIFAYGGYQRVYSLLSDLHVQVWVVLVVVDLPFFPYWLIFLGFLADPGNALLGGYCGKGAVWGHVFGVGLRVVSTDVVPEVHGVLVLGSAAFVVHLEFFGIFVSELDFMPKYIIKCVLFWRESVHHTVLM